VLPDGSYSIGPRQLSESDVTGRFEHCLAGEDPERRVRVVITIKRLGADGTWKLLNTEVRPCSSFARLACGVAATKSRRAQNQVRDAFGASTEASRGHPLRLERQDTVSWTITLKRHRLSYGCIPSRQHRNGCCAMCCRCTRSAGRGHTSPVPTCHPAASACRPSATTRRWPRRSCPAAGLPSPAHGSWWMPAAPSARTAPGCLAGVCLGGHRAAYMLAFSVVDRPSCACKPRGCVLACLKILGVAEVRARHEPRMVSSKLEHLLRSCHCEIEGNGTTAGVQLMKSTGSSHGATIRIGSIPLQSIQHFMLGTLRLPSTIAARAPPQFARAFAPRRRVSAEGSDGLQLFPGGVWSVVRLSSSSVLLEAGWLVSPSSRRVASRAFSVDGRLLHTSLATERRGSGAGVSSGKLLGRI